MTDQERAVIANIIKAYTVGFTNSGKAFKAVDTHISLLYVLIALLSLSHVYHAYVA